MPSDEGLSVGGVWAVLPPPSEEMGRDIMFSGPELWDKSTLAQFITEYDAEAVAVEQIAQILTSGKILGIVRGGTEYVSLLRLGPLKDPLRHPVRHSKGFQRLESALGGP